ncbi:DUF4382 domain-containing protein, partial [Chloroflexota bacterium]
MKISFVFLTVLAVVATLLAGCAPSGATSPTPSQTIPEFTPAPGQTTPGPTSTPSPATQPVQSEPAIGTIEVRVTDAPPEYGNIKKIWVEVLDSEEEGIAVHKAATDEQGEGEWITIPITGENPFDLLLLDKENMEALLGDAKVVAGKYTQIRMTVEEVTVIFEGDTEEAKDDIEKIAKLPSGKLKFIQPFEVIADGTTIILIDFLADKSLTITGKGDVVFKPVIKLTVSGKGKPIELEATLDSDGEAEAELSTEQKRTGKDSVHLQTTGTVESGDEARIVIPLPEGTTLGEIESISWWTYLEQGYIPHVDLELDLDADSNSENDRLVAEAAHQNDNDTTTWDTDYRGEDVGWIQTFDGASGIYTSWANWLTGGPSDVTSVNDETAVWIFAANDATYGLNTLADF